MNTYTYKAKGKTEGRSFTINGTVKAEDAFAAAANATAMLKEKFGLTPDKLDVKQKGQGK